MKDAFDEALEKDAERNEPGIGDDYPCAGCDEEKKNHLLQSDADKKRSDGPPLDYQRTLIAVAERQMEAQTALLAAFLSNARRRPRPSRAVWFCVGFAVAAILASRYP